jgi:hypothetical protein
MLNQKKKIDLLFLAVALVIAILQITILNFEYLFVGYMLGFLAASIIMQRDVKRFNENINMKIVFNMALHLLIYAATFILAIKLSDAAFIAAVLSLLAYRYLLILTLKRKVD